MTSVIGLVAQERLERAEADDLVGDLLEHPDALGAGQGEAFLVDDLAEDLLDLAPDLDLVGQVELRVEVLDDPVLDAELDVPERLARPAPGWRQRDGRRARPAPGRRRPAPGSAPGRAAGPGPARPAPGRALSIRFSEGHRLHPFSPQRTVLRRCPRHRRANSDFFWRPCRSSSAGRTAPLADDRPGEPEDVLATPAPRGCEMKNGTPRFRAYTTLRPSRDDRVVDLPADRVLDVRDADARAASRRG